MATSTNSRNLLLSNASSRTATNQKSLTVSATTSTFLYTGAGLLAGTPVIAITATKQNTLAPVVWSTSGYSVVLYSAAVGGTAVTVDAAVSTSSTVYLRGADFSAQSLNSLRVVASVTDVDVLLDSITITKLQSGLPGNSTYTSTVYFQNPLNPVGTPPPAPNGGSYNFNTASLTAPVSWAITQPDSSTVPTWACTYTFTGNPVDTVNAGTWNAVYLEAINGTNGTNGTRTAVLDLYQWASTAPTVLPSGSSTYTWSTAQFTNPATLNNWTQTPGTGVAGQTLYTIAQTYADTATSTTTAITWGTPTVRVVGVYGSSGLNGTRTAFLEVYQWALTTPTVFPSGTSTYTWATGGFTAPTTPSSWSLTPGASTAGYTLYACAIRYSDILTTATTSVTWNTSTAYAVGAAGGNGTNGEWRDVIQLYGITATAPTSVTYTFSNNSISTTSNWSLTQPDSTTTPTYMTTAVASTSTPAVGVVLTSWSTPVVVAQNGAAGAEGTKSITISIFKWSATAITTPPAQAFTYTWATGVSSVLPPTWEPSAPSSTDNGQTLYQVNLIISAVVSATTTSTNWSSGTISRIGYRQDGSIGPTGDSARVAYVVTTKITPPTTPTAGTANGGDTIPTSTVTNINGTETAWSFSATSTLADGQYMYQVDGIYKPLSTTIVWGAPYLSNLKVGSLSALAVDTGNLTVSSVGSIKTFNKAYAQTGGFFMGNDGGVVKFSIGDKLTYNTGTGIFVVGGITVDVSGKMQGIGTTDVTVDNSKISVGARNILPGSSSGTGWSGYSLYSNTEFTRTAASTVENSYIYSPYVSIPANTQITLSFESKQTGTINSADVFILPVGYITEGLLSNTYPLSTDWVKNTVTFTTPAIWVTSSRLRFDHNGGNGTSATIHVRNVKLEYGNKATDWTPAIEDVAADAQTKATAAQTAAVAAAALDATTKANTRLSKSASDTLTGPINLNAEKAITVGNPGIDTNPVTATGKDGFYIGDTGIVATKNGVATVTISNNGDATFAGTLAANTVTTNSLLVTGRGQALNDDPAIEDLSAWNLTGTGTSRGTNTTLTGAAGSNFFSNSTGATNALVVSRSIPIDPAKTYSLTANLYAAATNNRNMYIFVDMYSVTGARVPTTWGGTLSGYIFGGLPTTGIWTKYGGQFGFNTPRLIPTNVVRVQIGVWFQYNGAGTTSVEQAAQDIRLERVNDANLIVDGAITAGKINITAGNTTNRVIVKSNMIAVTDISNVIRIKIGDLSLSDLTILS